MWSGKCVPTYQKEPDAFIMRVDEPSLMNGVGSSGNLDTCHSDYIASHPG